jgi:hypothetical protein
MTQSAYTTSLTPSQSFKGCSTRQFSASIAYMLLRDFAVRHPGVEVSPPAGPTAMPADALALLAPNILPSRPFLIAQDLHSALPGQRHLSRWFAGQLLDSALVREVSALDRLAALLHLTVLPPKRSHQGTWFAPTLTSSGMNGLAPHYQDDPAWGALLELVDDEVTVWVRDHVRNAFIHRRRWPSALTSEAVLIYSHMDEAGEYRYDESPGLTASQHLAVVRMTWESILTPAIESSAQLVERASANRKRG